MNRVGFILRVKQGMLEEYKEHHKKVWPEMLEALSKHGWHNYSLYMAKDGLLFGYFETPDTFQAALDGMAAEEINAKFGVINLQPQIRKVFDIVKAIPDSSIFASIDELDKYLDSIQRKEKEKEG